MAGAFADTGSDVSTTKTPDLAMLGSPSWATVTPSARLQTRLGNLFRRTAVRLSTRCRNRRALLFLDRLQPAATDQIIDLGGGKGGYLAGILPYRGNVTIADVDPAVLKIAADTYGFNTVCLDAADRFPIADSEYDVVFCSSVIEHITGPREIIFDIRDSKQFAASARAAQANFAAEIRRTGKRYFVQTPYKYFPIEPHSFLPFFIVWLPRRWQIKLLAFSGRHWIKHARSSRFPAADNQGDARAVSRCGNRARTLLRPRQVDGRDQGVARGPSASPAPRRVAPPRRDVGRSSAHRPSPSRPALAASRRRTVAAAGAARPAAWCADRRPR